MKQGLLLMLLALAGCQTLERHPIATAVVTGIVVGVIAAHNGGHDPIRNGDYPAICRTQPIACQ